MINLPSPRSEMLSDEFDHRLLEDREEVDLLIVIGTSLRVGSFPLSSPAVQLTPRHRRTGLARLANCVTPPSLCPSNSH